MRMPRHRTQWIFGALLVSTALSAFAQDATLPPVALPILPPSAPQQTMPAVTLPSIAATPAATPAPATPAPAAPTVVSTPIPPSPQPATPSLPVVQGAASSATTSPATSALTNVLGPAAPPEAKTYSYGTSQFSILFLPTQVDHMRQAIHNFESSAKATGSTSTTFVAPEPVTVDNKPTITITEPPIYPVFYLASIAYHTPTDWSVWVSGHKITSHSNETDLTVVKVTPDSATFTWSPSYILAMTQRNKQHIFASFDLVRNRILKRNDDDLHFNDATNSITFTLRPNQSFSAGYWHLFEGYVAPPKNMPTLSTANLVSGDIDALPGSADAPADGGKGNTNSPGIDASIDGRTVMSSTTDLLKGFTSGPGNVMQKPIPAPTAGAATQKP